MSSRFLLFCVLLAASLGASAQVTNEQLLKPDAQPANWLSYSRDYSNQRHSPLNQISTGNVGRLQLQWVWQARSLEKFEATPLVVNGVLYTVQAPNDVVALDAATGRIFWTYSHQPSPARTCCGRVNRGLAILATLCSWAPSTRICWPSMRRAGSCCGIRSWPMLRPSTPSPCRPWW